MNGLEAVHKTQSFPRSAKPRSLSSCSLPGEIMGMQAAPYPSLSTSVSADCPVHLPDSACATGERADDGGGQSRYGSKEIEQRHKQLSTCHSLPIKQQNPGLKLVPKRISDREGNGIPELGINDDVFDVPSKSRSTYRLQSLDIVGESFESRFPWQRDVSLQCNLTLRRARPESGSTSSSLSGCGLPFVVSSADSPPALPAVCAPTTGKTYSRNVSHSEALTCRAAVGDPACSQYRLGHSNSVPSSPPCLVTRRANFFKRPRPSSMGALENLRYHSELGRFRDQLEAQAGTLSPQRQALHAPHQSPPGHGRRRAPLILQDDDSISDLESILEYPDEFLSDISRQTSFTSLDAEDDVLQHYDVDFMERWETSDRFRPPTKVLSSPCVSPLLWATRDDVHVSQCDELDADPSHGLPAPDTYLRLQRKPLPRRRSSGTVSSSSEGETEHEPSPPVARRGRRAAIYETKNCGDVSPATLSPEHSPSNSCDEGEAGSNIAERLRRRRSSVDLAMNIYPGDLVVQEHHKKLIKRNTIADFYARPAGDGAAGSTSEDVSKKGRQPFSILKLMKTRSKENLSRLDDILRRLKPSEFKDNHLAAYKNVHWSDLIASTDKQSPPIAISEMERKRREAVWELFKSECVFLIDHCMVLKHCFMEPLKKVQVEGSLMYAEPQDIFGNLDELCYVSYTFCKDFIAALLKDMSASDFGRTKVLIKAFQRFSTHSKDGAVYHTYCINYINALSYLEKLRQNSEFVEFERWCEQDGRCNRLQLADLLVAPVQHCTKLPLLLANIRKYTESEQERLLVTESIEKTELSLQQLEEKMKWIRNVERVQEIQRQIVWPSVAELDPRCQIPDCLKSTLAKQPCERLLSCTKRQLLHEGPLTLMETPKPIEVHVFLFEDLLLITKLKKMARKQKQGGEVGAKSPSGTTADRSSYIVFRQPLALDRFLVHDIAPTDASASGMKNLFVLVHISRFQQIIGLFSLQAASDPAKGQWVTLIREAKEKFAESQSCRQDSFKENKDPRAGGPGTEGGEQESSTDPVLSRRTHNNNLSRKVPSKSRSMDAVFV